MSLMTSPPGSHGGALKHFKVWDCAWQVQRLFDALPLTPSISVHVFVLVAVPEPGVAFLDAGGLGLVTVRPTSLLGSPVFINCWACFPDLAPNKQYHLWTCCLPVASDVPVSLWLCLLSPALQ